jgi:hypothetical protein
VLVMWACMLGKSAFEAAVMRDHNIRVMPGCKLAM